MENSILKEYEIENNIPIPWKNRKERIKFTTTLKKLEIGQSFFCKKNRNTVSTLMTREKKKTGKSFTTRSMDGGIRVWRIM